MKKISIILCLIVLCLLSRFNSQAQTIIDTPTILNALNQAPYLFEGKIVEQCSYKDPNSGNIYTNNIVDITKVIKGNIQCGKISMITEGGSYQDFIQEISHVTKFNVNVEGIFVCQLSSYPLSTNCPGNNNPELAPLFSNFAEIHYYNDLVNEIAMGFNSQFHDINDLYDFLQNVAGLPVSDCKPQYRPQDWANNNRQKVEIIPFVEDNNTSGFSTLATGDEIKYTFSNNHFVSGYGSTKYYECEVRVQANDASTYLQRGAFRLKYNPKAFGTNIASNIALTLSSNFPTANYGGTGGIQIIDKSDSVVSFIVTRTAGNRTQLTTTPQLFFTLKIPFDTCRYYPELKMIDTFTTINQFNLYTTTATGATTAQYNTVTATEFQQGDNCTPVITDVYSQSTGKDTIAGGIKEKVVIKGKHFGNTNGIILVPNADLGGTQYVGLENYDIVSGSWTDTQIVYTFPGTTNNSDSISVAYNDIAPGSGRNVVINKWKAVSDSIGGTNDSLYVAYSLWEWADSIGTIGYYKNQRIYAPPYADSSYTFQLHSSVTNPDMIACIRAAINKWRCLFGVNIKLDDSTTTTGTVAAFDNTNTVQILSMSAGTIASAVGNIKRNCASTSTNHPFPILDMDIRINSSYLSKFIYDTTGTLTIPTGMVDFYYVILHEIGHALGFNHVIEKKDLLFWQSRPTPILPIDRYAAPNRFNQTAGDSMMTKSQLLSSFGISCSGYTLRLMPYQDTLCRVKPTSIINPKKLMDFEVSIFPNPFKKELNIHIEKFENNTVCEIYDLYGKLVFREELKNNKSKLQLFNLVSGNYIIKIQNKNQWVARKIICVQ